MIVNVNDVRVYDSRSWCDDGMMMANFDDGKSWWWQTDDGKSWWW